MSHDQMMAFKGLLLQEFLELFYLIFLYNVVVLLFGA